MERRRRFIKMSTGASRDSVLDHVDAPGQVWKRRAEDNVVDLSPPWRA